MSCVVYGVLCASKNKVRRKPRFSRGGKVGKDSGMGLSRSRGDKTLQGWLRCGPVCPQTSAGAASPGICLCVQPFSL